MTDGTPTALELGRAIESGRADPRDLIEQYLDAIEAADPDHRIYYVVTAARARAEAQAAHVRAKAGLRRSPLDGVPLSWKDLFDSAGDETNAGSKMLAGRVPAMDALALRRAAMAGAICLGKTAMTELAFSGLGINPPCGTPANAHSTGTELTPGGSSSGAGVSIARGLCAAAIGTDTGGSVRIPAAWNGAVGFKPSQGIIPLDGVVPLSPTLDTIGPLTRDVADAAALFAVLAGHPIPSLADESLRGRTILVPEDVVWDECGPGIAESIEAALSALASAGATVRRKRVPEIADMQRLTWESGMSLLAIEGWAVWGETIEAKGELMYPPVRTRFEGGRGKDAAEALKLVHEREGLRSRLTERLAGIDALAMPTIPIDPPPLADLVEGGEAYDRANRLALRNPTLGNQLDLCAITLPAGTSKAGLPVGLMLMAPKHRDVRLLRLAHAAERAL